jgi:TPR repeat protein
MKFFTRWYFWVALALLLTIAAVHYFSSAEQSGRIQKPNEIGSVSDSVRRSNADLPVLRDVPRLPTQAKPLVSIEALVQQQKIPAPDYVLSDLGAWVSSASRGDPRAIVALSRSIDACLVVSDGELAAAGCVAVPQELKQVARAWLEKAAEKGDTIARLDVAASKHAELLLQNQGRPSLNPTEFDTALRYLQETASQGIEESFITLSAVYSKGTLDQRDEVKSVAYLVALSQLDGGARYGELARKRADGLPVALKSKLDEQVLAIRSRCC